MQLDGTYGLGGWRWIFILEGVVRTSITDIDYLRCNTYSRQTQITGAIGLLCIIFLVDFPDRAAKSWRFLSERQCAWIVQRINRDRGDADVEAFSFKKFLKPCLDLKIWGFAMIFLCVSPVPDDSALLTYLLAALQQYLTQSRTFSPLSSAAAWDLTSANLNASLHRHMVSREWSCTPPPGLAIDTTHAGRFLSLMPCYASSGCR